jgi:hypothetical protein
MNLSLDVDFLLVKKYDGMKYEYYALAVFSGRIGGTPAAHFSLCLL